MPTVLITGANRGLGLEFCRQYAADNWTVIACCRHPDQASELNKLAQVKNVQAETLDVGNFEQIDELSKKLTNTRIDVLINNAGIYGDKRELALGQFDYQTWTETLRINSMAPVKMAEAFLTHIKRGDNKLIINISSLMGSISDNGSGGSIFYRSSKAALNAAMKSLAIDLKDNDIGILTLHPGWVKTDMGGVNALISADESVTGMRTIIANFKSDQSGSFIRYDGKFMPW
jgi:NAD(P)-dependent dehydrogenase (short-subunit alcohol dehydrogenase family)